MGKEEKKRFGQLDKPCIFTIQGSYRGVPWRQTGVVWGEKEEGEPRLYVHLFLGAWVVRGGVTGRPEFTPPYWYLAFFSEGFRIFKTQTQRNVSLSVHTHTHTNTWKRQMVFTLPGRSTWGIHQHSSYRLHYQTPRSSLEQRKVWPVGVWQRTRIHPPQPVKRKMTLFQRLQKNQYQETGLQLVSQSKFAIKVECT